MRYVCDCDVCVPLRISYYDVSGDVCIRYGAHNSYITSKLMNAHQTNNTSRSSHHHLYQLT